MLSAAYISATIAGDLPGPGAVYISQSLSFRRPVRIGDTVVTRVSVAAIDSEKARVTLKTECLVETRTVVEGEAVVITRHGKPVVGLHPADSRPVAADLSIHDWLHARRMSRPASAISSVERMRLLHEEADGILP